MWGQQGCACGRGTQTCKDTLAQEGRACLDVGWGKRCVTAVPSYPGISTDPGALFMFPGAAAIRTPKKPPAEVSC